MFMDKVGSGSPYPCCVGLAEGRRFTGSSELFGGGLFNLKVSKRGPFILSKRACKEGLRGQYERFKSTKRPVSFSN